MKETDTISQKVTNTASTGQPCSLNWSDSPTIQKLLDVVVAILAEEFIQIVRKDPELFREIPASTGMTQEGRK